MTYYVSITGLQVKNVGYFPQFLRHAIPCKIQADDAEGNIRALTTSRNGIQHTLTVWKDRKSMTKYMVSGAHAQAMKVADAISLPGGTKVYGYESDTIPTWDEALALWAEHGTRHGKKVVTTKEPPQKQTRSNLLSTSVALGVAVTLVVLLAGNSYLHSISGVEPLETV